MLESKNDKNKRKAEKYRTIILLIIVIIFGIFFTFRKYIYYKFSGKPYQIAETINEGYGAINKQC